jgi:hypothetical protein
MGGVCAVENLALLHSAGARATGRPSSLGRWLQSMHVADALAADIPDPPDSDWLSQQTRYRSLVGALLYCATNTRPDVAYAVGMLCRCMSRPTDDLMSDAIRVLHYLCLTRDLGLRYGACSRRPYGMSDANWAVQHSTMGNVFMMHQASISWSSRNSVALSTCEAEIMAASEAAKEAVHLAAFGEELGIMDAEPIDLFVDNKAAIDLAYNPEHHQKTKLIQRRTSSCVNSSKPSASMSPSSTPLTTLLTSLRSPSTLGGC